MKNFVKLAGLASVFASGALALGVVVGSAVSASSSQAAQPSPSLGEGQGVMTELDANTSAVTYWASAADGWHVVTTIDTATDEDKPAARHAVVRFTSVLQPGQSQLISVPAAVGKASPTLRIHRLADRIEVTRLPE